MIHGQCEPGRPEGVASEEGEEPGRPRSEELFVRGRRESHPQRIEIIQRNVDPPSERGVVRWELGATRGPGAGIAYGLHDEVVAFEQRAP